MSAYANYREFEQIAHKPKDADASIFRTLLERASRTFDLLCGVEPEYFSSVTYDLWQSNTVYEVGEIVVPTTSNVHKYRVTTAGTSGATEPVWPTSAAGTVVNGTAPTQVTFTENGTDVISATSQTIYGDGTSFLKLPAYTGTIIGANVTMPSGYTVPYFVAENGYLIITDSTGLRIADRWRDCVPITISAVWGYDGTPEDIKQWVIELAIKLWRGSDEAVAKTSDLQGTKMELTPMQQSVVDKYRAKTRVAFA